MKKRTDQPVNRDLQEAMEWLLRQCDLSTYPRTVAAEIARLRKELAEEKAFSEFQLSIRDRRDNDIGKAWRDGYRVAKGRKR